VLCHRGGVMKAVRLIVRPRGVWGKREEALMRQTLVATLLLSVMIGPAGAALAADSQIFETDATVVVPLERSLKGAVIQYRMDCTGGTVDPNTGYCNKADFGEIGVGKVNVMTFNLARSTFHNPTTNADDETPLGGKEYYGVNLYFKDNSGTIARIIHHGGPLGDIPKNAFTVSMLDKVAYTRNEKGVENWVTPKGTLHCQRSRTPTGGSLGKSCSAADANVELYTTNPSDSAKEYTGEVRAYYGIPQHWFQTVAGTKGSEMTNNLKATPPGTAGPRRRITWTLVN